MHPRTIKVFRDDDDHVFFVCGVDVVCFDLLRVRHEQLYIAPDVGLGEFVTRPAADRYWLTIRVGDEEETATSTIT